MLLKFLIASFAEYEFYSKLEQNSLCWKMSRAIDISQSPFPRETCKFYSKLKRILFGENNTLAQIGINAFPFIK